MERVMKIISVRKQEAVKWTRMDLALLVILTVLVQLWSSVCVRGTEYMYHYAENVKLYRGVSEVYAGRASGVIHTWEKLGHQSAVSIMHTGVVKPAAATVEAAEDMVAATDQPADMGHTDTEKAVAAAPTMKETVIQEKILPVNNVDNTMENTESESITDKTAAGEITQNEERTEMELLELDGFLINENGVIESCKNPALASEDGIIIFPADERCTGIGSEALNGIASVEEIYIPANITSVAPGVLEKLENLMYIEVAPDNPVYESRDGILYSKNSELITVPAGRK